MRKIDRAMLKRALGGEYPDGPRASSTLVNEQEGRVYFLGWNSLYENYTYPLRTATHYPPNAPGASRSETTWQTLVDRICRGELEACLVLQVPTDPEAETLQLDRILDGVFFGEIVTTADEIYFRSDDRLPIKAARAPRLESA